MRSDQRSDAARAYRAWYNKPVWRHARTAQLATHPLCERCEAKGFVIAATTVNHRKPHKGDWALFIDPGNHASVCSDCHDGPIQSEERTGKPNGHIGFKGGVDRDGWPSDPRHPANATR